MEWIEVTGRTLEDAKEAALDELGVDEEEAEFEVLEEPRGGLFGRLRSEARVRARVLPSAPPPKLDRRERRRRRRSSSGSGSESSSPSGGAGPGLAQPRPAGPSGPEKPRPPGGQMVEQDVSDEEVAVEFVSGLLEAFGTPATVTATRLDEETLEVSIEGEGLGLLIGHRGQTLAALQELTRTVVQRRLGTQHGRLVLDVAHYRKRRREALARFAEQVAEEVRGSGVPRVLEPMVPADRKVVHDTVNEIAGVSTTSEGEEPRRRVVIVPEPRGG